MTTNRMIRRREVEHLTGLSRSAIYAAMKANTFPPALKIGLRSVAWRASEVDAWLNQRAAK
ncbi:helix-turn-helix transcriptional regulator [Albirhodobacter sp. R86504]|uniref:helix-turn-helix transcriptional regulator n=1 Tax=Albirhodobacter sp. R86504 TaxID=3093848 RepID=UPI00367233DD